MLRYKKEQCMNRILKLKMPQYVCKPPSNNHEKVCHMDRSTFHEEKMNFHLVFAAHTYCS